MRRAHITAAIGRIRALLDELERLADEEAAATGEDCPWMTIAEYATYARVSPDTVRRRWLAAGMPHTTHPIRIHRDEADAWRKAQW